MPLVTGECTTHTMRGGEDVPLLERQDNSLVLRGQLSADMIRNENVLFLDNACCNSPENRGNIPLLLRAGDVPFCRVEVYHSFIKGACGHCYCFMDGVWHYLQSFSPHLQRGQTHHPFREEGYTTTIVQGHVPILQRLVSMFGKDWLSNPTERTLSRTCRERAPPCRDRTATPMWSPVKSIVTLGGHKGMGGI